MNMSKNLKDARKAAKLTQQQVADVFGIKREAVSQWESGAKGTKPDIGKLERLSQLYKKSISELLGEEKLTDEINTEAETSAALTPEQQKILSLAESIGSEDRAAWLKLGASLAKSHQSVVNDPPKPQSAQGVNEKRSSVESISVKSWPEIDRRERDIGHKPDRRRPHFGIPDMKRLPKKADIALKRERKK